MTRASVHMIRSLLCVCLFATATTPESLAGENAHAETFFFTWALDENAAGACIGKEPLQDLVRMHLGKNVFTGTSAGAVRIEGQLSSGGEGGGWFASFQVFDSDDAPKGERRLQVPSGTCRELDHALSLVLALLIDPDFPMDDTVRDMLVTEESDGEAASASVYGSTGGAMGGGEAAESAQPTYTPPAVSPPQPLLDIRIRQRGPLAVPDGRERFHGVIGIGAALQPGLLMRPIPAPRLSGGIRWRRIGAVIASITYFTPQTEALEEGAEATLSILRFGLDLRPRLFTRDIFVLEVIAGYHGSVLWFAGNNFTSENRTGHSWLHDIPLGVGAVLHLTPILSVGLDLGAAIYAQRETIIYDIDGVSASIPVHRLPRAAFSTVLEFLLRL